MENLDTGIYRLCMLVYGGYAWEMATARVLPMDFRPVADDFVRRLAQVSSRLAPRTDASEVLELGPVMTLAERFARNAAALEERRSRIAAAGGGHAAEMNAALKHLSRVLTWVRGTVSGRYDQDTYGLSALRCDIPNLQVVEKLIAAEPGSHPFHLWATKARRERNKVSDALRQGNMIVDRLLG
jgi:hypothetical protein